MADSNAVARPYARAIFEFALENKALGLWSKTLGTLAQIASSKSTVDFIKNPSSLPLQHAEFMIMVLSQLTHSQCDEFTQNFLNVLADNKRLLVLPDIYGQFQLLREEYEKTIEVEVISFSHLTKQQETALVERLSKRLQRKVILNVKIDKSLHGGAIIRAGHLVFDASVVAQVQKLSSFVAA